MATETVCQGNRNRRQSNQNNRFAQLYSQPMQPWALTPANQNPPYPTPNQNPPYPPMQNTYPQPIQNPDFLNTAFAPPPYSVTSYGPAHAPSSGAGNNGIYGGNYGNVPPRPSAPPPAYDVATSGESFKR